MLCLAGVYRQKAKALSEEDLASEWQSVDAVKAASEEPITSALRQVFDGQLAQVLDRLADVLSSRVKIDLDILALLLDLVAWSSLIATTLRPLLEAALEEGFRTGALRISYSFSGYAASPSTQGVLESVLSRTQGTGDYTLRVLGEIISGGLERGSSIDEMARAITEQFEDWKLWRAKLVAQTAVTPAFEASQLQAWQEAGIAARTGLTQRDGRVRRERFDHYEFEEQTILLTQPFEVGGELLMYPGDSSLGASAANVINCRCSQLPILNGAPVKTLQQPWLRQEGEPIDISGLNDRERQRVEMAIRDYSIRTAYPEMRDAWGQTEAIARLSEEYHVSTSTVKRALWM